MFRRSLFRTTTGLCGVWLCCALMLAGCSDSAPGGGGEDENNAANNDTNNDANNDGNNDVNNDGPVCGDGQCDDGEDNASCPDDCEPPGPVCGDGQCDDGEDNANCPDDCEPPGPVCGDGQCDDGEDNANCPDDCAPDPICEPGEQRCQSENSLEVCNEDGTIWEASPCEVGTLCVDDRCAEVICLPGEIDSCASQTSIQICDETGTGVMEQPCEEGFFCDFVNGAFACTNQICEPGMTRCRGLEGVEVCAEDGTEWVLGEDCADGTQCDEGACRSLCEINSKVSSFLGCEYWSLDLDNIEGGTNAAHAVVISNPNTELAAEITVYRGNGDVLNVPEWNLIIPPGGQGIYRFEDSYRNTNDNSDLLNTAYIDGTMIGDQSFRFESSIPTTAHQFNPLVERNVFTNDASLLLPSNSVGTEYLIMSWKHRSQGFQFAGFATVLAFGEEPTTVSVTPSVTVRAGTNKINNQAIPAIGGGETREFVLQPGEYLNIETEGPAGADLTGTSIVTSQPSVVFGGHECANIPEQNINFCDHIEQQMIPVGSWGSQYVISSFVERGPGDQQVFRILASEDQTVVTTTPAQPGADNVTLNRGEFIEFTSAANFEIAATAPILLGQYMTGSRNPGGASIGDPAFTLAAPIEQWRRDYIVLTPQAYNRGDYLNVIAPTGATVLLDGMPVMGWAPVADGTYSVAKVTVQDGQHTLLSEDQFTVIAYGYDSDVSYAYPGGLNLESINQ